MAFSWLINGGDPNHVSKSWDDPPSGKGHNPAYRTPRSFPSAFSKTRSGQATALTPPSLALEDSGGFDFFQRQLFGWKREQDGNKYIKSVKENSWNLGEMLFFSMLFSYVFFFWVGVGGVAQT